MLLLSAILIISFDNNPYTLTMISSIDTKDVKTVDLCTKKNRNTKNKRKTLLTNTLYTYHQLVIP